MEELEHASSVELKDPDQALKLYHSITSQTVTSDDEAKIKEVELALSSMGKYIFFCMVTPITYMLIYSSI